MKLYSIYDGKAQTYSPPVAEVNEHTMKRSLIQNVTETAPWRQFAGDYTLTEVGLYDEHNGVIHPHPNPINLGLLSNFMHGATDQPGDAHLQQALDDMPDGT